MLDKIETETTEIKDSKIELNMTKLLETRESKQNKATALIARFN